MNVWTDPGEAASAASRAAWEQAARESGAALEKLTRATEEGVRMAPLYDAADAPAAEELGFPGLRPWTRGLAFAAPARGWEVLCEHDGRSSPAALTEDLRGGAEGLHLRLGAGEGSRSLDAWLAAIDPGAALISLAPGDDPDRTGLDLLDLLQRRGVNPQQARAALGFDPAAALLAGHDPDALSSKLACLVSAVRREWPQVRVARSSGQPWHEAGADAALELGLILAGALTVLRAQESVNGELDAGALELLVCVDVDLYRSVAKLRALRRCFGRVLEATGLEPALSEARIVARTSERMLSQRDPWTNSLRATLAATAAATGGADALIVLPFEQALPAVSARGRRLARNTQLVLREEARLHQVLDPWGGSHFMERLTDELARAAWARLQEVERLGGLAGALRAGWIAERLAETRAAREKRVARRQDALIGVSDYPLPGEAPPAGLSAPQAASDPLAARRIAAPWEALWLESAAHAATHGAPPRVALIALGPLAEHLTRSTWIANLLAAAGIEAPAPDGPGATDAAGAVSAFQASGAQVAVLCGTDARYAALTASLAPALRAAGARHLLQAGAPGEQESAWRSAGVDGFLAAGSDVLAACRELLARVREVSA